MNKTLDLYSVTFKIKRVKSKDSRTNYTILDATIEKYERIDGKSEIVSPITEQMMIQGYFKSLKEGDTFEGIAKLRYNRKYGNRYLLVNNPRLVKLEFEEEVSAFLQRRCKHTKKSLSVGKKTADKIVDALGLGAISRILDNKDCLYEVEGMSEARVEFIYNELRTSAKYEELLTFLEANGLKTSLASSIYEEFKDNSIVKIRENPYLLYKILNEDDISFTDIDRIGKSLKFEFNSQERLCSIILYYIDYRIKSNGDLYVTKNDIYENLYDFALKCGHFTLADASNLKISKDLFDFCFNENLLDQSISLELNSNGDTCVYRKRYKYIENNIVKSLVRLLNEEIEPFCTANDIDVFIEKYERETGFILANAQKGAIYMALTEGFSILTGGPGTGKTATTSCILKCIRFIKPDAKILLLAPTGKASKRMQELCVGEEAKTIHRALKLNPAFQKKMTEEDILEVDYIFVDESSMVDAVLCNSLLERISLNTRVILVGDVDQLPSVGAGLILRDLINSKKVPVTRLTELFRQAQESQIVTNSHKVINGNSNLDINTEDKKDFFFWQSSTVDICKKRVLECYKRCIFKGYTLSQICILSPMKTGELGTKELNKLIQAQFNSSKIHYKIDAMNMIKVNDRVMQIKNNYDLEVFNGEIGDIVSIREYKDDVIIEVDFGDRTVFYKKDNLQEIELAYCITIHKSQGSEFPAVITIISDTHTSMLNRNLIYTAWTRAKEVVLNVGQKEALDKCVLRNDHMSRNSRIIEKLQRFIDRNYD